MEQMKTEVMAGNKDRYIILLIVLVGVMMAVIDGIVVSIALPTITAYFNVDVSLSQWLNAHAYHRQRHVRSGSAVYHSRSHIFTKKFINMGLR